MDKTRILPPLVRGKVTGVLDFFVDEIRLFSNILLLTDNFDLVLQIQWWGEVLPAYIRPKKLQIEGRKCGSTHSSESHYHSAKYEIRTTLDLFKLYLTSCEVAELSVLEAVENYVIGSAFLRDLISLLNKNNDLIILPIFDCLGEQIGDVIMHINFLEVFEAESEKINNKMTQLLKNNCKGKKISRDDVTSSAVQSNFLREKGVVYDGCSKNLELGLPVDQYNFKSKKKEISNLKELSNKGDSSFRKQEISVNNNASKAVEMCCRCYPEVKSSNDLSKVLYFGLSSQRSVTRSNIKNPNLKLASKFNSNSVKFKCKSKSAETLGGVSLKQTSGSGRSGKKNESSKNLRKSATDKEKCDSVMIQKGSADQSAVDHKEYNCLTSRSESVPGKQTDLCNIPLKQPSKVLDYLLGSDMSKDDEKIALNDFKQMSPSHNLVSSISQLCLVSDRGLQKPESRFDLGSSDPVKQSHLNFDFGNPIERSYYEKFFLKSNPAPDLEIAELLNQPENRLKLGTSDSCSTLDIKNVSENSSLKSYSKHSHAEREGLGDGECLTSNISGLNRKSCSRCKYYKKLDELDTIIESLKHFEQKILSDEKEMQSTLNDNLDAVIKKNLKKS